MRWPSGPLETSNAIYSWKMYRQRRIAAKVTARDLREQMEGVWYNNRLTGQLRDEAPSAYKDVRVVLKAQKELVRVVRTLRSVLNYKGV